LSLGDRGDPYALTGSVLVPRLSPARDQQRMLTALEDARRQTGTYVAIDSPEYLFRAMPTPETIQAWVGEVRTGLQRTGLRAVVNLNCRTPPPWAVSPAGGAGRSRWPKDSTASIRPSLRSSACGSIA